VVEAARTSIHGPALVVPTETRTDSALAWVMLATVHAEHFIEPEPTARALIEQPRAHRHATDQAVIDLLVEHLDTEAVDIGTAKQYLDRHGPFDPERAEAVLERLLTQHPADQHVTFYLEAMRQALSPKED